MPQRFIGHMPAQPSPLAQTLEGMATGLGTYQQMQDWQFEREMARAEKERIQEMHDLDIARAETELELLQEEPYRQRAEHLASLVREGAGTPWFEQIEASIVDDPETRELIQNYLPGIVREDEDGQYRLNIGGRVVGETHSHILYADQYGETEAIALPEEAIGKNLSWNYDQQRGLLIGTSPDGKEIVRDVAPALITTSESIINKETGKMETILFDAEGNEISRIESDSLEVAGFSLQKERTLRELALAEKGQEWDIQFMQRELDLREEEAEESARQFNERIKFDYFNIAQQYTMHTEQLVLSYDQLEAQIEEWKRLDERDREQWQEELILRYDQMEQNAEQFEKEYGLSRDKFKLMVDESIDSRKRAWKELGLTEWEASERLELAKRELLLQEELTEAQIGNMFFEQGLRREELDLAINRFESEAMQYRNISIETDPTTNQIVGGSAERWDPNAKDWVEVDFPTDTLPLEAVPLLAQYQLTLAQLDEITAMDAGTGVGGIANRVFGHMNEMAGPDERAFFRSEDRWRAVIGQHVDEYMRMMDLPPEEADQITGEVYFELFRQGHLDDPDNPGTFRVEPHRLMSPEALDVFYEQAEEYGLEASDPPEDRPFMETFFRGLGVRQTGPLEQLFGLGPGTGGFEGLAEALIRMREIEEGWRGNLEGLPGAVWQFLQEYL